MGQMGSAPFASTRRRRRDGGAFSPLALYANGEAGGWYDPSDLTPEKVSWRRNLLTYSEQFDNSAWVKQNAVVTANSVTAPDGTQTADTVAFGGTLGSDRIFQDSTITVVPGTSYTASVWIRSDSAQTIRLQVERPGPADVEFVICNVTTSWQRFTLTHTPTWTGSGAVRLRLSEAQTIGANYYIWGAQLEVGTVASSYQRITDFTSDFLAAFPQHALYQDSAGTTPVTALGQPVGLVLDKSKGGLANLGSEQLSNSEFTSNVTGWIAAGSATVTWDSSGAALVDITGVGGGIGDNQTLALTVGRMYRMLVTVRAGTFTGQLAMQVGGSTIATPTPSGSYQTFAAYFTAASTDPVLGVIRNTAATGTIFVDTFSVREVPGAHAIQATSASRPTCDARVNLLTYSEQFENAVWTKSNSSITANAGIAPDGTNTADKLVEDTVNQTHWTGQSVTTAAVPYVYSVYAKAVERGFVLLYHNESVSGAVFDLSTGAISTGTGIGLSTAAVTNIGNGWWRCSITVTATAASNSFRCYVCNTSTNYSYTGNGTSGLLLWGADLRLASDAAYPYQRVVTASDYADVQAPRYLTFDGIDDSLYTAASVDFATWTSGTRRNLLTYPSAFDNAYWARTATTVSANNAVAPDGTQTADTLVETTAASTHSVYVNAGTYTGAYTQSVYVKPAGRTWVFLEPNGGSATRTFYNLSGAGSLGTVGTNVTASIAAVGNGWYRITATFTYAAAAAFISISLTTGDGVASYTGDGTSGVLLWGAQLELGSTATAFQDVGTDKMTVVTGVRKLVDSGAPTLVELSAAGDSNNGAFMLRAPWVAVGSYYWSSRGTSNGGTSTPEALYPAPITNVLTCGGDIAGDIASFRVNGISATTGINDQGAGTYGTYVLFIGRRNNATNPFNGRLYQLLVRGAQTDTATVQQTERFVAGKTGVVLP